MPAPNVSTNPFVERSENREAWAGDRPAPGGARDRLLDATARCIVRDGMTATGVASVASEAGVSRPTVYRYFADRHALVSESLLRAGVAHASATADHVRQFKRPDQMAIEAELFVLKLIRKNPLLSEVWSSATLDATLLSDATGPATLALSQHALVSLIEVAQWSEVEAAEAIELMLRFLISLLVAPAPHRSEPELRAFLERRLVPALGLVNTTARSRTNSNKRAGPRPVQPRRG